MNPDNPSYRPATRRDRVMATVAAVTASVAINGAVLLCFDTASPDHWLVPTPRLLAHLARCDDQATRQAQIDCKQQVVAATRAVDRGVLQVARQ